MEDNVDIDRQIVPPLQVHSHLRPGFTERPCAAACAWHMRPTLVTLWSFQKYPSSLMNRNKARVAPSKVTTEILFVSSDLFDSASKGIHLSPRASSASLGEPLPERKLRAGPARIPSTSPRIGED